MGNVILGSDGIAIRQGVYEEKSTQETDLGRFIDFQDGRRFRYCKAGETITRGHMLSSSVVVANDNTVTQTAMTVALSNGYIGEKEVNVLLAAATTAHLYADGFLTIEGGLGLGYIYRIKDNKAGGALYTTPCALTLYDPIVIALDATTILTLTMSKYKDVIINDTTVVAPPVGVPLIDVTDDYYFWAQTRGYAAVVVDDDGALTVGQLVGGGGGDAGAGIVIAADTTQAWGVVVQVAAQDTYATIDLHLE